MNQILTDDVNEIHSIYGVVAARFGKMKDANESNASLVESMKKSIEIAETECDDLRHQIERCDKSIKVLQGMTDERNEVAKVEIEDMINKALTSVFIGESYSIRIDEKPWGNYKIANLVLVDASGRDRSLQHANGDGIKQLISFLCNVLLIKFTGSSRILITDELFNGLSPEYAALASDILVELAEKLDFQFIMVEHNPGLWSNEKTHLIRLKKTVKDGLVVSSLY